MVNTAATKVRDSNIELFRIIVMFFIVAHHCVVNLEQRPLPQPNFRKKIIFSCFLWLGRESGHKLLCPNNRIFHVYFTNHPA